MINTDRIIPVTAIDLLSLYGLILKGDNVNVTALEAADVLGDFTVATAGTYLANQPVKSLDFTAASGTVYFVAGYDYEGFKVNGEAVTPTGDVLADGRTLYKAVLATGAVTITKVGF